MAEKEQESVVPEPSGVDPLQTGVPPQQPQAPAATGSKGFVQLLEYLAFGKFLHEEIDYKAIRVNESDYLPKHRRLVKLINRQNYIIIALVLLTILTEPYLHPINVYYAKKPGFDGQTRELSGMVNPNMTDEAVLSWVEASITEILTFGFGDFDRRILAQRHRFTSTGWESFLESLRSENMREAFKLRQLVLTTAPSNAPVIVSKGLDADNNYIWVIQLPVIMTYTTNNNVRTGQRSIVTVTVARVPTSDNVRGIGIKMWRMI